MTPRFALLASVSLFAFCVNAATFYVDASSLDDTGVATNWTTAKQTIQAAVNIAASNDTVLVTNGTYNVGAFTTPGYSVNNRLVIARA